MPSLNYNLNIIECVGKKRKGPFPILMQFLIVGGGGGAFAKTGNDTTAGGGAGGFITGSYCFDPNETKSFSVGAGGFNNGSNSIAFGLTAIGGGKGGANINGAATDGQNGGSGGGTVYPSTVVGLGTPPQGFNGGIGTTSISGGGGGGGASANGGNSNSNTGAAGGDGKQWFDGTYYAGGGGGSNYKDSSANSGPNGLGYQIGGGAGAGGAAALSGTNGIVAVRYLTGERVVVTNGSTVILGNFTYHYFTSNGSIKFIGDEQQDSNINPCQ